MVAVHVKENATPADITKAYRAAFPNIKNTYQPEFSSAAQFWFEATQPGHAHYKGPESFGEGRKLVKRGNALTWVPPP